jgi:uncharacterized membrane protein YdbT with pleckstrin-like domain
MGNYVQKTLMPDEKVIYDTRLHWIIYVPIGLELALAAIIGAAGGTPFAALLIVVAVLHFLIVTIRRATSEFVVTDKKVVVKVGWLSVRTIEINRAKIESVDVTQGLLGRLVGCGSITVVGTGATREPFRDIENPLEFRRAVQSLTP